MRKELRDEKMKRDILIEWSAKPGVCIRWGGSNHKEDSKAVAWSNEHRIAFSPRWWFSSKAIDFVHDKR
jgi:hypothetical protein